MYLSLPRVFQKTFKHCLTSALGTVSLQDETPSNNHQKGNYLHLRCGLWMSRREVDKSHVVYLFRATNWREGARFQFTHSPESLVRIPSIVELFTDSIFLGYLFSFHSCSWRRRRRPRIQTRAGRPCVILFLHWMKARLSNCSSLRWITGQARISHGWIEASYWNRCFL